MQASLSFMFVSYHSVSTHCGFIIQCIFFSFRRIYIFQGIHMTKHCIIQFMKHSGMISLKTEKVDSGKRNSITVILWRYSPNRTQAAFLLRFLDRTQTHIHALSDLPERVIDSSQRPLPTQQTRETNIYALVGIRTRDSSNRTTPRPLGSTCC